MLDRADNALVGQRAHIGIEAKVVVFTADSPAAVDLFALLRRAPDLDRLILAVASIDDLLASLGLDENQRLAWYRGRPTSRRVSGVDFRSTRPSSARSSALRMARPLCREEPT